MSSSGAIRFVRLRPRPDGNYAAVAAMAMRGIWEPTSMYFAELYLQQLKRQRTDKLVITSGRKKKLWSCSIETLLL